MRLLVPCCSTGRCCRQAAAATATMLIVAHETMHRDAAATPAENGDCGNDRVAKVSTHWSRGYIMRMRLRLVDQVQRMCNLIESQRDESAARRNFRTLILEAKMVKKLKKRVGNNRMHQNLYDEDSQD